MSPVDTVVEAANKYPKALTFTVYGIPVSMIGAIVWFMTQGALLQKDVAHHGELIAVQQQQINRLADSQIIADRERAVSASEFANLKLEVGKLRDDVTDGNREIMKFIKDLVKQQEKTDE